MPLPEHKSESTPESLRGTRIHKARETGSALDLQDEGEVAAYQNWLKNEQIVLEQWRHEFNVSEPLEELEQRLWLYEPNSFNPILSGRLDVMYVEQGTRTPHALIIDGKTLSGLSAGKAEDSWQLRCQAVLAAYEFGAVHVRAAFLKPEAWGKQVDVVDFDAQSLQNTEYMIRWHIWFSSLPDAPRRAGAHCTWCPCAAYCPERAAQALIPSAMTNGVLERIDTLSPRDLKRLWDSSTLITKMLARVDYRLSSLPAETLARVGLYRGAPKETDTLINAAGLKSRLQELGLQEQDIMSCADFGKTKLVKLIRREFALSSDAKAEAWMSRNLEQFIETKTGARSLKELKA